MISLADIQKSWPLKDIMGRYRTQSLFEEFTNGRDIVPVFNLTDFDTTTLSAKKIYLDIADITEYKVARALLGSWDHWVRLTETSWFQPYISSWRDELELKIKSEAIENLRATSREEGGKGANAARWLAEGKWEKKPATRKKREARLLAETEDVDADMRRLGLVH